MKTKVQETESILQAAEKPAVKMFGVGSAGVGLLEAINGGDFAGADFVAVNTDAASLAASSAALKIHLETKLLRGLGTGGDPERGRAIAEEQFATLKTACDGADVVFIVAGLGGGAGSGITPVLARAAKETGALVLAFVTLPFTCEGNRRQQQAQQSLEQLKLVADGVICLPCQKTFKLMDGNTGVLETFRIVDELLIEGVRGVWRLLARPGLIQIHSDDLCALLRDGHSQSAFASVEASGPARAREVVEKLLNHPMLDEGRALGESDAVLVSLMGGKDLTMAEVDRVMEQIGRSCEHAQVIMGAAVDEALKTRLSVTLIAARRTGALPVDELSSGAVLQPTTDDLAEPMISRGAGRSARCNPPASSLTPEQRESLPGRRGGGRGRKNAAKMSQTQLPLAIITKGRFDKSEPTIHKGEDLDIPTYIRRGVALNYPQ
jgi:cell division protein FtsZ